MNLAVHGLEGDIRHGESATTTTRTTATGSFDFVLANPPFNVNAVDKERLKDPSARAAASLRPAAHRQRQLPLDPALLFRAQQQRPRWLRHGQLRFRRPRLRAGNPAETHRGRAVDVMVAVGPNMFYTVTLPCTLWFFDMANQHAPR